MSIPTSKATQMIIGAMQYCEKYNATSNESFNANFISGYPRNLNDIEDYMKKVNCMLGNTKLVCIKDKTNFRVDNLNRVY